MQERPGFIANFFAILHRQCFRHHLIDVGGGFSEDRLLHMAVYAFLQAFDFTLIRHALQFDIGHGSGLVVWNCKLCRQLFRDILSLDRRLIRDISDGAGNVLAVPKRFHVLTSISIVILYPDIASDNHAIIISLYALEVKSLPQFRQRAL
ncbi:hypothetical protein SDC9_66871 [bioreactor metagenome]|uniref:Uncharacterized protein n=1 Tax=bioreactor metagenome TaxID=1076179 RepID=A0A644XXP9_9ZZZZ